MASLSLSSTRIGVNNPPPAPAPRNALATFFSVAMLSMFIGCAGGPASKPAKSGDDLRAEARTAFLAQDYPRTLAIIEPQALAGMPWAQYTLGYMYYYGRGVTLDRVRAREWMARAASQGYPAAKEALRRTREIEPPGTDAFGTPTKGPPSATAPSAGPPGAAEMPPTSAPGSVAHAPGSPSHAAISAPKASSGPVGAETPPPVTSSPVTEQSGITKTSELSPSAAATPPAATLSLDKAGHLRSNEWIAAQDPRRLTLQLIGSSDKNAVLRYIGEHGIGGEAAYYVTKHDDQTWYVVIYGDYPDRDAAQAALQSLPPALRAASPWIRQFGEIRAHLTTTP